MPNNIMWWSRFIWMGISGAAVVGKNPIEGVAGFGHTVNEVMADLVIQTEHYHRNWEEFVEED
jgi:hypothetical protein